MTVKEQALQMVEALPEDTTWGELLELLTRIAGIRGTAAVPLKASSLAFLEAEIWSQIPPSLRGKPCPKSERERILGIGPDGI